MGNTNTTFVILRDGVKLTEADSKARGYASYGEAIYLALENDDHASFTLERQALGTSAEMARVVI